MFGTGSLDAGTLLGLGVVLLAVGAGTRLAATHGFDPFPVPLLVGLIVSAVGPLDVLRPDTATTRAGAEIALVVLRRHEGGDRVVGGRPAEHRRPGGHRRAGRPPPGRAHADPPG